MAVFSEDVELILKGEALKADKAKALHVWYSNFTSSNEEGLHGNPSENQVFQKRETLFVAANGSVRIRVNPEEVYTFTTLSTGQKGAHASTTTPQSPFRLPCSQPFDTSSFGAMASTSATKFLVRSNGCLGGSEWH